MTWELVLRLLLASLLGGIIGYEREVRAKGAGIRTHVLVALASALFMIISQYGFTGADKFDASRVAAQVVSGIGFIGAGIIIFHKNSVRGLTTAAGLWVTSAIGLGTAAGLYVLSAVTTALVLICLEVMHYYSVKIGDKILNVTMSASDERMLTDAMRTLGKQVEKYSLSRDGDHYKVELLIRKSRKERSTDFIDRLSAIPGVSLDCIE